MFIAEGDESNKYFLTYFLNKGYLYCTYEERSIDLELGVFTGNLKAKQTS